MRIYKLKAQVWLCNTLTKCGLIDDIWRQCEIDLAKIEGKRLAEYLNNGD